MVARLGAKAVLIAVAVALVFFGVGLIGLAIATALAPRIGTAQGYAVAGGLLLLPPLIFALAVWIAKATRPAPPVSNGGRELMNSLMTAVARETPWAAVIATGVVGVANLFLNRHKTKK